MKKNKVILSVIILNYNSGKYLSQCLESIVKSNLNKGIEIIIVDNKSSDESFVLAQKVKNTNSNINFVFLPLESNLGFAAGNNQGVKKISSDSKYVLFLNPDTTVEKDTLKGMINFFESDCKVDAATCFITLALTGKMQPECHRGFPYPWRSFCHFSGLSKLFPHTKLFDGYFLGHLNMAKTHLVEACVGAFLMVKKSVGETIGWWNEKYFFYGEDLDFCYKLRQKKFRLYFVPDYKITHFQGVSSGLISKTKHISQASRETKIKSAKASTQAMRIFYQENLVEQYPFFLRPIIMAGIKLLEIQRVAKARYL